MAGDLHPLERASNFSVHPHSEQVLRLNEAFASGEVGAIAQAIGAMSKTRGMTEVARRSGVTRAALYKAFCPVGDPRLHTLVGALRALGLKLQVVPTDAPR